MVYLISFCILFFVFYFFVPQFISYLHSRRVSRKYNQLIIVGYENSIIYLARPSNSNVSPVGYVPVLKARCFDYNKISFLHVGSVVEYSVRFSLFKEMPEVVLK